jgi:hypothetical protein
MRKQFQEAKESSRKLAAEDEFIRFETFLFRNLAWRKIFTCMDAPDIDFAGYRYPASRLSGQSKSRIFGSTSKCLIKFEI